MDYHENEENDNKFPHGLCSNLLPQFDLEDNVHPFTHLQQVQLRAQILVYGSLMRDTLPVEPYMVLAFGEFGFVEGVRGGGRSTWETAWLVAQQRIDLQSDTFSTPVRAGGVGAHPSMTSPVTPTLSLLRNISSHVQTTLASEPVSSLRDGHHLPSISVTPIAGVPSSVVPNVSAGSKSVLSTTSLAPPRPNFHVLAGHADTEQPNGISLSHETCRQIDQAQQQAEEASLLAAAAVKYSQSVWTQLAIQKSSGFVADKEANLASAAVTIAAAAAVAKAAAAGARIASDAALQAKLMADEVLVLPDKLGKSMSDECIHGGVKSTVNFVSPASILKGEDRTNYSDSILVAAREVSKKRVEAASAATRRAENWDAVVKAAVMAAEAVSQASTITGMGEPLPFTLQELVEAGPENYWKAHRPHMFSEVVCAEEGVTRHIEHNLEETEGTSNQGKKVFPPNELSKQVESSNLPVNGMRWGLAGNSEKGLVEQKPGRTSGLDETIGSAPKYQVGSICALENSKSEGNRAAQESARISTENQIEEGSVPEVLSCEEGLGLVWLPAKVLNLKDGKAYVCCTEVAGSEGPDQLRECVLLDGEEGQAPRIYENSSELAKWVTGVELDPAKVDTSELQKLKTMLEKERNESRSKDEFLKKSQAQLFYLESRVRSQDQLCKDQQEEVEELARKMHLKLDVQNQYEKQVCELNDKLKDREENCNDLQRKVIELESKLKERETSVFLALQRKIKELEVKLKEKPQQQSDSVVLQLMQPDSRHLVPPKPLSCDFRDSLLYRPVALREVKRRHDVNKMGLANEGLLNLLKKKDVPVGRKVPTDPEKGRIDSSKVYPRILRVRGLNKDDAVGVKGDVTKGWPR